EVLLDYVRGADREAFTQEVQNALNVLVVRDGKVDPALPRTLEDTLAVRRGAAAEALARRGGREHRPAVRKLLQDSDPVVRLRVALALVSAGDREAVAALIDSLTGLPLDQPGQAEDALRLLAGEQSPEVSLGEEAATRRKCRDAWLSWWKDHGAKVDLARIDAARVLQGYTVLVEVDGNGVGRVREVSRDGRE